MDFQEVVHTRRSIRNYTDQPVAEDMINAIVRAGMAAPSAGNQQPWHFIVIRERAKLNEIPTVHPHAKMVLQAPVAILVCGDPDGKKYPMYWPQDCSAATQNILLAARNFGLGTVWAGVFPDPARIAGFRRILTIPENVFPFALVPIGWPATDFQAVERFNPALLHYERW